MKNMKTAAGMLCLAGILSLIPSSENSINFIYFSALGTFILLSRIIITYPLNKVKIFL